MPAQVSLLATAGALSGRTFVFGERTTCIVGRASDCDPQIVDEGRPLTSRHHCLFDVNPPDVRVRDLGSRNGTFVNGTEIGRRRPGQTPEEGARQAFRERDLFDGDEVMVGETVLRIFVHEPATCARCFREVPDPPALLTPGDDGVHECDDCRAGDHGGRGEAGEVGLDAIHGYEIVRELGRGGQGVVFLARHKASGELIALKLLLAEVAVRETARLAFMREIDTARVLRHPNIVEFRDTGSSGTTFYFACEYCDAGGVDRLMVERGGTISIEEALPIVFQVLDGLAYAHTRARPVAAPGAVGGGQGTGFVHRDLKPSNILLARSGARLVAKVADFGLSKAFDQAGLSGLTRTGSIGGTVAFMARQQVVSYKFAKPEVDVWAVAATLYNMITGALPRDFPAGMDQIAVVLDSPAIPIRERRRALPSRLAAVIDEALIERPEIPIKSALELKHALEQAL